MDDRYEDFVWMKELYWSRGEVGAALEEETGGRVLELVGRKGWGLGLRGGSDTQLNDIIELIIQEYMNTSL